MLTILKFKIAAFNGKVVTFLADTLMSGGPGSEVDRW